MKRYCQGCGDWFEPERPYGAHESQTHPGYCVGCGHDIDDPNTPAPRT